jgi:hypothetical protein
MDGFIAGFFIIVCNWTLLAFSGILLARAKLKLKCRGIRTTNFLLALVMKGSR